MGYQKMNNLECWVDSKYYFTIMSPKVNPKINLIV